MFQASNEPEWLEYLQELIIDVIWILGNYWSEALRIQVSYSL